MIACRCRTITSKKRNNQTQYCVRSKYFHYFSLPFFHIILLLDFLHSSGWPFESSGRSSYISSKTSVWMDAHWAPIRTEQLDDNKLLSVPETLIESIAKWAGACLRKIAAPIQSTRLVFSPTIAMLYQRISLQMKIGTTPPSDYCGVHDTASWAITVETSSVH